jgi:DNA-directed RNA polymerase subunit RPC12/RpoP
VESYYNQLLGFSMLSERINLSGRPVDRGHRCLTAACFAFGLRERRPSSTIKYLTSRTRSHYPEQEKAAAMISFTCPGCGKKLETQDDLGGSETNCPACKTRITIPIDVAVEDEVPTSADAKTITLADLESLRKELGKKPKS